MNGCTDPTPRLDGCTFGCPQPVGGDHEPTCWCDDPECDMRLAQHTYGDHEAVSGELLLIFGK